MYNSFIISGACEFKIRPGAPFTNVVQRYPARISNYIHHKVWAEITYPFPNCTVEVWEWKNHSIPHFTKHVNCEYLSLQRLKIIHVCKRGPWKICAWFAPCYVCCGQIYPYSPCIGMIMPLPQCLKTNTERYGFLIHMNMVVNKTGI